MKIRMDRMDLDESLEKWLEGGERAGDSSCLSNGLVIAALLCGVLLAGAACWTFMLIVGPCIDVLPDYKSICEREFFMREKWSVVATVAIAGLFVILVIIRRYIVVVNGEGGL